MRSSPWSPKHLALTVPDLHGLLAALVDEGVEFVVIGGVAVAAHGFIRGTDDLDLVPAPDRRNLDRLLNALVRQDARLTLRLDRTPGPEERRALYRGRNMSLWTRLGDVDIVQRPPGVPEYAALAERALEVAPFGVAIKMASRDDLLAMKRTRGSALDAVDVERLQRPAE